MTPATTNTWTHAWANRRFRVAFFVTLAILIATLSGFRVFLDFVELRRGVVLNDPVLSLIPPADLTWLTFTLIYGGLASAVVVLSRQPDLLLRTVQAYIVMIFMRVVFMYATPLDPPQGSIPLGDPLVEFFGSSGVVLTRDLFFSGHTATLVLLGLGIPGRRWRAALFAAAGTVALCLLWQHVHYTIDVLAAPLAAYSSFRIAGFPAFRRLGTIP